MAHLHKFRPYVFSCLAVAAVTACAVPLRNTLTLANLTMVYLLLVLIIAVRTGTGPAFVTTFVSFMCINFFLVPPFYSLWVADPREVLDLFVFLLVAGIAGRLAARERQQAQAARQRAYEQEILYRLTRSFNQLTTKEGVYQSLTKMLCDDLTARYAHVLPQAADTPGNDVTLHFLLLRAGERIYGTVRAAFDIPLTPPQLDLLNTCVSQAAMALERIELAERASKSQQFEEADKLKTAILHAVSHDLRTPMTIIKTSASNLRHFHNQLTAQEEIEIAETIEHETDQLDKLVGNLLDLSRLKAGALSLNRHPNSLEEIAGDVAARVWQLTKQERVKIIFPDDMPLVSFDYGLLLQAVTNIVDNSLRYEPPDWQIEIRGEVQQQEAWLKVVNHGEIIPDEMKDQVMEPFFHGPDGRIGLGLPIAKGITEAHQGRLWVEDTPGGGATFVLVLPLDEEQNLETENPDRG